MTARRFAAALVPLALALAVIGPVGASAKVVSAGGPVDVQLWPQDGKTVVITSVELPAGTKLPTLARVPVAPGTTVEWAGEIVGADGTGDIPADYRLVTGEGGQYAEFYLTKSLRAQIDSVGATLTVDGSVVSTRLDWVQSVSASQTMFAVRVPSGASAVKISPAPVGKPVTNEQGEALYALPTKTLAAGEKTSVTLSYDTAPQAGTSSQSLSAESIAIFLGIALAIAIAVLVVVVRRRSV